MIIKEKIMSTNIPEACCTLDIDGEKQEKLVAMFKALGNPTRLEIMKFLVTHPGCITGDIVSFLPIAQATVSQHLKVLRDAGFIEGTVTGVATSYCLHKENIDEYYEILSEHFISSENYIKGSEYCQLAEKKAEKAGAFNDAIVYGNKLIACLEKLPQTEEVEKKLIDARTKLGLYYIQLQLCVKAKKVIDPIVGLATKWNYKRRICQINCIIGCYKDFVEEDAAVEIQIVLEGIGLQRHKKDQVTITVAASLTVATGTGDNAKVEKRTFSTTSPSHHIDYWVDNGGNNFREQLMFQLSHQAQEMVDHLSAPTWRPAT